MRATEICRNTLLIVVIVVTFSCTTPTEPNPPQPNKPVAVYDLAKLTRQDTYVIPATDLKGIAVSNNGQFIYVVGAKPSQLMSFNVEKNRWEQALGNFKKIPKASNRVPVNLNKTTIDHFSPSDDGLLITLQSGNGLIVLKGSGAVNANYYEQGHTTFPRNSMMPLFVTKNPVQHYVYLFDLTKQAIGVRFRPYTEPISPDTEKPKIWNDALAKSHHPLAQPTEQIFSAAVEEQQGNLLMADREGIKRLKKDDIGIPATTLDRKGEAVYSAKLFSLDKKTSNNHVTAMALVDKKYLLVGLKSSNANTGGIAFADITKSSIEWETFGLHQGLSVKSIATEHIKNYQRTKFAAVITTDKGFLFFGNEGKMLELVKDKGYLVNAKFINDHRAEVKNYENATSGFVGDRIVEAKQDGYLGAAQGSTPLWYLVVKGNSPDENGVFTLDIKIDQAIYQEPLELPDL